MQTDWTDLQSKTIDALRFPLAVAVVFLHYCLTVILDATGPQRVLCLLFQEGICRLAVPCFFLLSGFLFFNGLQDWSWPEWGRKMRKRVRTLLVPYLLWNVIALLARWIYNNVQAGPVSLLQQIQEVGGIRMFWSVSGALPIGSQAFPVDGPLWFIRDLMLFVVLTPAIHLFLRWTKGYGVLGLCVLFLAVRRVVPEGLLFFVFGAWMQLSGRNLLQTAWPRRYALLAVAVLSMAAVFLLTDVSDYWARFCKLFFLVSGIGSAICLAAWGWEKRTRLSVPFLAGSSFFIFAAHEVLILQNAACPLVASLLPTDTVWGSILAFFLTPALAVAICLGLLFLLQRFLPRTAGVLTGGRKPAYR